MSERNWKIIIIILNSICFVIAMLTCNWMAALGWASAVFANSELLGIYSKKR